MHIFVASFIDPLADEPLQRRQLPIGRERFFLHDAHRLHLPATVSLEVQNRIATARSQRLPIRKRRSVSLFGRDVRSQKADGVHHDAHGGLRTVLKRLVKRLLDLLAPVDLRAVAKHHSRVGCEQRGHCIGLVGVVLLHKGDDPLANLLLIGRNGRLCRGALGLSCLRLLCLGLLCFGLLCQCDALCRDEEQHDQ